MISTGDVLSATVRSFRREPVTIIFSMFSSIVDYSAITLAVNVIADKPDKAIADAINDNCDLKFTVRFIFFLFPIVINFQYCTSINDLLSCYSSILKSLQYQKQSGI
jgi:hypothetical protein